MVPRRLPGHRGHRGGGSGGCGVRAPAAHPAGASPSVIVVTALPFVVIAVFIIGLTGSNWPRAAVSPSSALHCDYWSTAPPRSRSATIASTGSPGGASRRGALCCLAAPYLAWAVVYGFLLRPAITAPHSRMPAAGGPRRAAACPCSRCGCPPARSQVPAIPPVTALLPQASPRVTRDRLRAGASLLPPIDRELSRQA